jgi:hypothetical protein
MDRFSLTQAIQPNTNDGQSPACLQSGARCHLRSDGSPTPISPGAHMTATRVDFSLSEMSGEVVNL